MVQIESVSKIFTTEDGAKVAAVDGLTLHIESGSMVVIMGPNGSGKTTLFKILDGQLIPDSGKIVWNGSPGRPSATNLRHRVAHVPQEPRTLAFQEMTIAEHLLWRELEGRTPRFWSRGITRSRINRYRDLLIRYGANPLADSLTRPLSSLSVGWQQIFVLLMTAIRWNEDLMAI